MENVEFDFIQIRTRPFSYICRVRVYLAGQTYRQGGGFRTVQFDTIRNLVKFIETRNRMKL